MDSEKKLEVAVASFRLGRAIAVTALVSLGVLVLNVIIAFEFQTRTSVYLLVASGFAFACAPWMMRRHDDLMRVLGIGTAEIRKGREAAMKTNSA